MSSPTSSATPSSTAPFHPGDGDLPRGVRRRRDLHREREPLRPHLPEVLQTLFEPFRRGPSASRASSSIGLGLYIARHLIDRHGGKISVESSAAGTRFVVRLPADRRDR